MFMTDVKSESCRSHWMQYENNTNKKIATIGGAKHESHNTPICVGAATLANGTNGGHRKCALPNSIFQDGFDLKVLLCLVKSPCGDSIDNDGDLGSWDVLFLNFKPIVL
jgi:hypothetical protein